MKAKAGGTIGYAVAAVLFAVAAMAQGPPTGPRVDIPAGATALEGLPTVRVDATPRDASRRALSSDEAAKNRLVIRIADGRFYWASRDNRPLDVSSQGAFTYLSSSPGRYIRLTQLDDRIAYVEHVDDETANITWWGELKVVLGK